MNFYNPRELELHDSNDLREKFQGFANIEKIETVEKPESLVFSGGGIKGLAYAGAIRALEEKKLIGNIKKFAGASAGAITAALLAIGMSADEIQEQMSKVNFASLLQKSYVDIPKLAKNPAKVWNPLVGPFVIYGEVHKSGLCDGTALMKWLTSMFRLKGFDDTTTFKELKVKTGNELSIVLCCVNYSKTVIASPDNMELYDMPIVTAIRGSFAIPFIFEPLKWNNNIYIDGGTMYNYPIDIFDNHRHQGEIVDRAKSLGFVLASKTNIKNPSRREDPDISSHLICIYEALKNVAYEYCFRTGNEYRTVFVDSGDIGLLDFELTTEQKKKLVDNGYNATMQYLEGCKSEDSGYNLAGVSEETA